MSFGKVQVSQDAVTLNGRHQFLVSADVNLLVRHKCYKGIKTCLLFASKAGSLEVKTEKTKYRIRSFSGSECRTKLEHQDS
jgi:hypothetical protein